jgi:hypothetical protein
LKMITWSRHSRRTEPMILSTYGFCQGARGATTTSSIPFPLTRARKAGPYDASRSRVLSSDNEIATNHMVANNRPEELARILSAVA